MKNPNLMVSSFMKSKKINPTRCKSCFTFLLENFCLGFFYLGLFWFVLWLCAQFIVNRGHLTTRQEWLVKMQQLSQQVEIQPISSIPIPSGIEMITFIDEQITYSSLDLFSKIPQSFFYQSEGTLGSYYYQKFLYNHSTVILLSQFPHYLSDFSFPSDLRGIYLCLFLSGSILIGWLVVKSMDKTILRQLFLLQDQLSSSCYPMHYQIQEFSDFAMILFSSSFSYQCESTFKSELAHELIDLPVKLLSKIKQRRSFKTNPFESQLKNRTIAFHPHFIAIELHDFLHQTTQDFQNMADQHDVILHCQSCRETVFVIAPLFQKTIQSLVYQAILNSPVQGHVQLFAQVNQTGWQVKISDQATNQQALKNESLNLAKQLIQQSKGTLLIQMAADGSKNQTILQFPMHPSTQQKEEK